MSAQSSASPKYTKGYFASALCRTAAHVIASLH